MLRLYLLGVVHSHFIVGDVLDLFLPPLPSVQAFGGDLYSFASSDVVECATTCLTNSSCISFNFALGGVKPLKTCGIVGECYSPNVTSCPSFLSLSCPGGIFTAVDFASYGEPVVGEGPCDFSLPPGACNNPNAVNVFHDACVGKSSCVVDATLSTFGEDPCPGHYHFIAAKLSGVNCSSSPPPPTASLCTLSTYSTTYTLLPSPNTTYYQRLQPRNDAPLIPAVPYLVNPPAARSVVFNGAGGGLLSQGFSTNVAFLSHPSRGSVDDLLFPYRKRHNPNATPPGKIWGWDDFVPGSVASMILMGSGQALKWTEAPALRAQLTSLLDGISAAAELDGFAVGYAKSDTNSYFNGNNQNPSYVNSWFTHGMLDSADVDPRALKLARDFNSWWNNNTYLPQLFPQDGGDAHKGPPPHGYDPQNGYTSTAPFANGHMLYWMNQAGIGHSRIAMSTAGTQADLDFLVNLFQEDWWLEQLAAKNLSAVYARKWYPDNYEICVFECYLDMYTLTGKSRYLDAVLGGWALYKDPIQGWMFPGGSFSLNENFLYPPGSLPLEFKGSWGVHSRPTGELCPSAFWIKLNHRLHRLYPDSEVYIGEIEQTLINVALAGQGPGGVGVRYFARLHGEKDPTTSVGTCCEGQSARIWGGVPELIFSQSVESSSNSNGKNAAHIRVNLFEPSTLSLLAEGGRGAINITIATGWPWDTRVDILVEAQAPCTSDDLRLSIRVPGWVNSQSVPFYVSGAPIVYGLPGTYTTIPYNFSWGLGVSNISFSLPMAVKPWAYTGVSQVPGFSRAAFSFGPILLAAMGEWNNTLDGIVLSGVEGGPSLPAQWLVPSSGSLPSSSTFSVKGVVNATFVPYYSIQNEKFTVYPLF